MQNSIINFPKKMFAIRVCSRTAILETAQMTNTATTIIPCIEKKTVYEVALVFTTDEVKAMQEYKEGKAVGIPDYKGYLNESGSLYVYAIEFSDLPLDKQQWFFDNPEYVNFLLANGVERPKKEINLVDILTPSGFDELLTTLIKLHGGVKEDYLKAELIAKNPNAKNPFFLVQFPSGLKTHIHASYLFYS